MARRNKPGKMSVKQEIRNKALEGLTDNDSRKTYRAGIDKFFAWIRPEDGPERFSPAEIRTAPQEAIQAFADHLAAAGKSAATIHTYIAPICKGCGVTMERIRKPARKAVAITRSRERPGRDRSREEEQSGRYSLSVELQKALGVRRAELARLKPEDLQSDIWGLYVVVERGKGGKYQEQRILPADEKRVQEIFSRGLPGRPILAPSDIGPKIDYHAMRAEHAREAYRYYLELCRDPARREFLRARLNGALMVQHPFRDERDRARVQAEFEADMDRGGGVYKLRGELRSLAIERGRPVEYDRVALMAVSVFHLSHWRNEVTISHYMV